MRGKDDSCDPGLSNTPIKGKTYEFRSKMEVPSRTVPANMYTEVSIVCVFPPIFHRMYYIRSCSPTPPLS